MYIFRFIKRRPWISVAIVVAVLIVISLIAIGGGQKNGSESFNVIKQDLVQQTKASGQVNSENEADLSFEELGTVSKINVKVGDRVSAGQTIVSLDARDKFSALEKAKAELFAGEASLMEKERGTRSEEIILAQNKSSTLEQYLNQAEIILRDTIRTSYASIEDAIFNYADIVFKNPRSVNPEIDIMTNTNNTEKKINNLRFSVGKSLALWKVDISSNASTTVLAESTKKTLYETKEFIDLLADIVNDLTSRGSGLSQADINIYRENISKAQITIGNSINNISSAESSLISARNNYFGAKDDLNIKVSGSTFEELEIERAKLMQAGAGLVSAETALSKMYLISPIDGIVGRIEPKIGETIKAGELVATVVGDKKQVEVDLPEIEIGKVSKGNEAEITLDAYGEEVVFKGYITKIDPVAYEVDGVPTYKVTVVFGEDDPRILSGKTANINIISAKKEGVLAVPFKAIYKKDGKSFVSIYDGSIEIEKMVEVGIKSASGLVEIISGLNEGDVVVVPSLKNN